jgi:hypothetical protein
MIPPSYTREIIVSCSPANVYQALTAGFSEWWTSGCESIAEVGDQITFRFGDAYWVMRANILNSDFIELECVEGHHLDVGQPEAILTEWEGTKLKWNIQAHAAGTKIEFTHEGLTITLHCYDACEEGWDHFFVGSLKKYLDNGVGTPFLHHG